MANVYDFYKPHLLSEYPEVDGPLTQTCYPGALERSYDHFRLKETKRIAIKEGKALKEGMGEVSLEDFDFVAFHSPYGKLVQKGFARLVSLSFAGLRAGLMSMASYTTITFLTQLLNDSQLSIQHF